MKRKSLVNIATVSILIMLVSGSLFAQWQQDSKYGFKINIPTNWNKNSYADGTDQVYDYMSADENIAIQLRAFEASAGFTTALLAQVYEESMLPAGTQKLSLDEHTTANGIPSRKGIYLINYNGTEVGLSALYIVQNNIGFVLTALIPTSMMQQRGEELKRVVKSFTIEGFAVSTHTVKQDKKPSGLSGLVGGANNNNQANNNAFSGSNTSSGNSKHSASNSTNLVYKGQTYRTVKIGNQIWMAENLNVGTMITKDKYPQDNGVIEKYCLFDDPENCKKYGGFYLFKEMMQFENLFLDPANPVVTQGICPDGWHLPTDDEWKILEGSVDSQYGVGDPEWDKQREERGSDVGLKLRSKTGWIDYGNGINNNGNDNYGFAILPAGGSSSYGSHRPSSMGGNEMRGKFWTATPQGNMSYARSFNYHNNLSERYTISERFGLSVRCVKN